MRLFYRIILWNQQEEMRFLVVLCLLSVAVALPTPEQLRTNLSALPNPPELKSDEKDKSGEEAALNIPPEPQIEEELENSGEARGPLEVEEKPIEGQEEAKEKPDDDIKEIQQESKESKEDKDSKEKSKESKESKEPWEPRPEEPKEEKKEKDSKESKEKDDEDVPVLIEIISKPKGFFYDILSKWFPNAHIPWPFNQWRSGDLREQPIYIVSESDFDLD